MLRPAFTREFRVSQELRHDVPIIIVLLGMIGIGLVALPHLPARVPTHFAANGQPNEWSVPFVAVFFPIGMATGVWLLMLFLPAVDPRRRAYADFADVYRLIRLAVVLVVAISDILILLRALGVGLNISTAVTLLVAGLFLVLGNVLPKIQPTWFVGIRTPWTLSSDTVWRRTHRLAGRLFVAFAFLPLLAVLFLRHAPTLLAASVVVAGGIPAAFSIAYSWWLWSREGRPST